MTGRAYGRPAESRYQHARMLAESERARAIQNRCTGRRKSTAANPLPCVYQPIGNGDLMGCKHCPRVRQLTNVEYRAKYGVDRPPSVRQRQSSGVDGWWVAVGIAVVVVALLAMQAHNLSGGAR